MAGIKTIKAMQLKGGGLIWETGENVGEEYVADAMA